MLVYCVFTLVLSFFYFGLIGWEPIVGRVLILAGTWLLWRLYMSHPCDAFYVLRVYFQLIMLVWWYPDIYNFARFMPNTDHVFAAVEQQVFGCQPALLMSQWLPGVFWRELFSLGYFSYYPMIAAVVIWATLFHFRRFDRTTVVIFCSFMIYYIIFLFLQSAGPQYYFQVIGMDEALKGNFPNIGTWFTHHPELTQTQQGGGLFTWLVHLAQGGERPIAAFPSSHVGVSTIVLLLAFKMSRKLFKWLLPFYILLCLSTVYIGAHYAIDVLAGWLSSIFVMAISMKIYKTDFIHRPKQSSAHHHHHRHHHHHHH